jgi:hypothetical protein
VGSPENRRWNNLAPQDSPSIRRRIRGDPWPRGYRVHIDRCIGWIQGNLAWMELRLRMPCLSYAYRSETPLHLVAWLKNVPARLLGTRFTNAISCFGLRSQEPFKQGHPVEFICIWKQIHQKFSNKNRFTHCTHAQCILDLAQSALDCKGKWP